MHSTCEQEYEVFWNPIYGCECTGILAWKVMLKSIQHYRKIEL